MGDIQIRKATKGDELGLLALKLRQTTILLTQMGNSLSQVAAWQEKFATLEYVKKAMRAPNALYVLEVDGELNGMAGISIRDDGDDSFALFGNLYCGGSNKGWGSRLMEYRLGVVSNFNVDYLQCHVHRNNEKAQRFVQHYGFDQYGSYRDSALGSDNIIFRREQ